MLFPQILLLARFIYLLIEHSHYNDHTLEYKNIHMRKTRSEPILLACPLSIKFNKIFHSRMEEDKLNFAISVLKSHFQQMEREDEDFGEGYIAESHPLRPTHLMVPLGGRSNSRAPSISSSVSDLDVPIYTRETTIPLSARKVKLSSLDAFVNRTNDVFVALIKAECTRN